MNIFLQVLITGIAMGFIYALVGIEYTIIWNATGLLNFSHDKFIMLSGLKIASADMAPNRNMVISVQRIASGSGSPEPRT